MLLFFEALLITGISWYSFVLWLLLSFLKTELMYRADAAVSTVVYWPLSLLEFWWGVARFVELLPSILGRTGAASVVRNVGDAAPAATMFVIKVLPSSPSPSSWLCSSKSIVYWSSACMASGADSSVRASYFTRELSDTYVSFARSENDSCYLK